MMSGTFPRGEPSWFYEKAEDYGTVASTDFNDYTHQIPMFIPHGLDADTMIRLREQALRDAGHHRPPSEMGKEGSLNDKPDIPAQKKKPGGPITVLHVGWGHPPNMAAGPIYYLHHLCREQRARDLNVSCFVASNEVGDPQKAPGLRSALHDEISYFIVDNRPAHYFDWSDPRRETGNADIEALFRQVLENIGPDIVHFHNLVGLSMSLPELARQSGAATLLSAHNYWMICPRDDLFAPNEVVCSGPGDGARCAGCVGQPNRVADFMFRCQSSRLILSGALDKILAVSDGVKRIIADFGIEKEKIITSHIGSVAAAENWRAVGETRRGEPVLADRPVTFGYFGTISPRKGVHILLEAVKHLQNREGQFTVAIHGYCSPGPYAQRLSLMMEQDLFLKQHIQFQGGYRQVEIPHRSRTVDVAIIPPVWEDNGPQTVMETLGAGLPVLGAEIGGIPDFVQDKQNGMLFHAGDARDLARVMETVLADRALIAKMRGKIGEPLAMGHHVAQLSEIYRGLLADCARRHPVPALAQPVDSEAQRRYQVLQALAADGRRDGIFEELCGLVADFPDFAPAQNDLGVLFFERSEWAAALTHCRLAVQYDSGNATFLKNLADLLYVGFKKTEEALSLYLALMKQSPNDVEVLTALGKMCIELSRFTTAETLFRKIIELQPSNEEAQQALAVLRRTGLDQEGKSGQGKPIKSAGASKWKRRTLVSIVIPVFNKLEYTRECLKALEKHTSSDLYETIIVDNNSTDGTHDFLAGIVKKVKVITNQTNLGFTAACNQGAREAQGDHIVFLNNDTKPRAGWLEAMIGTINSDASFGIVGSKLVYPDGRLQEAGGIIFSDGSGWNYGRFDDPEHPRYNYVREVDYVSGAAFLIRRTLLEDLGYFDERYSPGYYEDTDLCFQARAAGYRVVYCPFSRVIHHEGISSGTDLSQGMKKYQVINKEKFVKKWASALKNQFPPDRSQVISASERGTHNNILIIDPLLPMFDRASGSLRLFQIVDLLRKRGDHITFIARDGSDQDQYVRHLQKMGIEVYATDPRMLQAMGYQIHGRAREINLKEIVTSRSYQWAILSFYDIAVQYLPLIRRFSPETKIFIDTVDIHFLREARLAVLENDKNLQRQAGETQKIELGIYRQADTLITVTEKDWQAVKEFLPGMPHVVIPNIHAVAENAPSFADRQGLLFVGNFNHTPNGDAVRFFIREVWPRLKNRIPEITLTVVGNNPPEDLRNSDLAGLEVTGYVPSTLPYLEKARVAVAPLRYGAGMKGKVGEALAHGLPVVSTSIGAEGMGLQHGENVLIADTPEAFAERVEELYSRPELWEKLSVRGREAVREQWSPEKVLEILEATFAGAPGPKTSSGKTIQEKEIKPEPAARRFLERPQPVSSIVIPAKDNWEYTRLCLDSLVRYADIPYELVIIDNGSATPFREPLKKWKRKNEGVQLKYLRSNKSLGFAGGVNLGLQVSRGEFIIILNNDTIVTPGLFSALLRPLVEGKEVGVTGPVSNFVAGDQLIATSGLDFPEPRKVAMDKIVRTAKKIGRDFQGVTAPTNKLVGLCLALRRETVAAIGGFDERFYPGNFEDVDYSIRAIRKGFKLLICREAFLYHFGNRTFRSEPGDYRTALKDNLIAFMEKWGLQEFKHENELHEIPIARPWAAEENLHFPINREDHSYVFKPNGSGFIKKALKAYGDSPFMWPSRLIIPSEGSDPGEIQQKIETLLEENNLADNGEIVIYSGMLGEILEGLEGARCLISSWNGEPEPGMRPEDITLVL